MTTLSAAIRPAVDEWKPGPVPADRPADVPVRPGRLRRMAGIAGDAILLLVVVLLMPIVVLIVGSPLVLVVRLVLEIVQRR
jgi:hypothetical protein